MLDRAARHPRQRRADRVRARIQPLAAVGADPVAVPRSGGLARGSARRGAGRDEIDIVPVVVKAGGGSFHHNLTWHGSSPNTAATVARMALVSHMLPVEARFHPANVDLIYSRYRRRGDLSLDESFFPVMWDRIGGPYALARRSARHRSLSAETAQSPRRREART